MVHLQGRPDKPKCQVRAANCSSHLCLCLDTRSVKRRMCLSVKTGLWLYKHPIQVRRRVACKSSASEFPYFYKVLSDITDIVFCGCETWSLTLREEHRLRVFENGVLRRIFGPTRDEVTGEWRKLHNEELNGLYFSPNIKEE